MQDDLMAVDLALNCKTVEVRAAQLHDLHPESILIDLDQAWAP